MAGYLDLMVFYEQTGKMFVGQFVRYEMLAAKSVKYVKYVKVTCVCLCG